MTRLRLRGWSSLRLFRGDARLGRCRPPSATSPVWTDAIVRFGADRPDLARLERRLRRVWPSMTMHPRRVCRSLVVVAMQEMLEALAERLVFALLRRISHRRLAHSRVAHRRVLAHRRGAHRRVAHCRVAHCRVAHRRVAHSRAPIVGFSPIVAHSRGAHRRVLPHRRVAHVAPIVGFSSIRGAEPSLCVRSCIGVLLSLVLSASADAPSSWLWCGVSGALLSRLTSSTS